MECSGNCGGNSWFSRANLWAQHGEKSSDCCGCNKDGTWDLGESSPESSLIGILTTTCWVSIPVPIASVIWRHSWIRRISVSLPAKTCEQAFHYVDLITESEKGAFPWSSSFSSQPITLCSQIMDKRGWACPQNGPNAATLAALYLSNEDRIQSAWSNTVLRTVQVRRKYGAEENSPYLSGGRKSSSTQ